MADQKEKPRIFNNPFELVALLICLGFTIVSAWERYLYGFLFFGLCSAVFIYSILDKRKKISVPDADEFNKRFVDPGIFTYLNDGFNVGIHSDLKLTVFHVKWTEIRAMFAYKVDMYATDLISLDVFTGNSGHSFRVTEDTPGWYMFLEKIAEQFPTIDKLWHIDISVPAFETKLTLIYEWEQKALAEAENIYYKIDQK